MEGGKTPGADALYYEILSRTGFVRTFYEALKSGVQKGIISRIFLTGVSPKTQIKKQQYFCFYDKLLFILFFK